ncbi:MAG: aldehyde dehydrogenase family protein [bacterium]
MSIKRALFINGNWIESGEWEEIRNPYDGSLVGRAAVAGKNEAEQAVRSSIQAYKHNRNLSRADRREVLMKIAQGLKQHRKRLANLVVKETGKPIGPALGEVDRAVITFTLAAEETIRFSGEVIPLDITPATAGYYARTERFPIGPIIALSPFNFPINLTAHKVAPAIAVGSAVVLKAPPQCPLSVLELANIVHEAGAAPGTLNVLHCPIPLAENLVRDDRFKMLSFTGSSQVGWHLKSVCGKKKVALELGGNAAAVVHEDADLDWTAKRLAIGAFVQAGQVCISVQRILVHRPVYEKFKKLFLEATKALHVGNPMNPKTVAGPCIDLGTAKRVMEWIKEAEEDGGKILCGGTRRGSIVRPTVIEGAPHKSRVKSEEVFGPVVTLDPYTRFEQACAEVNRSVYGLQAGIFTHDTRRIEHAFQILDVGGVIVNDFPTFRVDNFPYGGIKDSGFGREGVRYSMEEMSEIKILVSRR